MWACANQHSLLPAGSILKMLAFPSCLGWWHWLEHPRTPRVTPQWHCSEKAWSLPHLSWSTLVVPWEETGLAKPAKRKVKAAAAGVTATGILEKQVLINPLCQIKATCALACGSCVAAAFCCDSSPACFHLPLSSVVRLSCGYVWQIWEEVWFTESLAKELGEKSFWCDKIKVHL